eukprot:18717-Eustigmatos_ZCMA.PRE.1
MSCLSTKLQSTGYAKSASFSLGILFTSAICRSDGAVDDDDDEDLAVADNDGTAAAAEAAAAGCDERPWPSSS